MKEIMTGNQALARGALAAGVKVVAGYPGTPSTEAIASLLEMDLPGTSVEWSVNEKVAFEVAAGAAWAGHRALCTMKMSGLNVCYDSLIGVAYSGCPGALVVYVADDPGVSAGMAEQDTREFAKMADVPMLEPCSLQDAHDYTLKAFEISEKIQGPVFVRLVTANSQSHGAVEAAPRALPRDGAPLPPFDPSKYTKAGAAICMQQHRDLLARLEKARALIDEAGLDKLSLGREGGLGVISVGCANGYLMEALEALGAHGVDVSGVTTLRLAATVPFAKAQIGEVLARCGAVLVVEELEGLVEDQCYKQAYRQGASCRILGKEDGTFSRVGEYNAQVVARGLCAALGAPLPEALAAREGRPESLCAARPIGFCAGCPHRGTYMGLERGLRAIGKKKEEVFITGDIGCTILGSCPPFDILWTELSMGASIPLAQGMAYGGIPGPVIATIGDSTFFHGGMPGLANALQHGVDLLVVILDNGWTAMTGMQVNPGTPQGFQKPGWRQLDIEGAVRGLGVTQLWRVDAYDAGAMAAATQEALSRPGVKVILSRRECAIQSARHERRARVPYDAAKCVGCKRCIVVTGCPAISLAEGGKAVAVDFAQCNGCGLCATVCPKGALGGGDGGGGGDGAAAGGGGAGAGGKEAA